MKELYGEKKAKEVAEKMSESKKGKLKKKKLEKVIKSRKGRKMPTAVVEKSVKTKKAKRESMTLQGKRETNIKNAKPFGQYTLSGEWVRNFYCIKDTFGFFGHPQKIINCLKGITKQTCGFTFKYLTEKQVSELTLPRYRNLNI